jgi:NADH:ubiquinone oxidoreductase subunit 5 (subunit L)/multisubunit Na+/H+ antiporter MnhA subunit
MLLILVLAVLGKSSQSLQSYWLPMAMERPTPVSSLLHSSTMVVAGVMFSLMIGWLWLFGIFRFLSLFFIALLSLSFYDVKKIVAFSTSCHLSLMLCMICFSPGLLVLHIITHRFVKGSIFIVSGAWIHFVGSQDLRLFSMFRVYHVNIFILMGFGIGFIHNSKEFVLFGSDIFLLVFVMYVVISLRYSSVIMKHGNSIRFGSFGMLINVMLISVMVLSGIFNLILLDFG